MTRTLVVLCALAVGACNEKDHKGQDLAACKLEAVKVYPHWQDDQADLDRKTANEPYRPGQKMDVGPAFDMGDFTRLCMKAKGYEWNANGNQCGVSDDLFECWKKDTREQCYRKTKGN
jgi:hypothetical protein